MYKKINAFVIFFCGMIQHLNVLQMQFFALSAYIHKNYIYFLSLRFTLGFFFFWCYKMQYVQH